MHKGVYPAASARSSQRRRELAPDAESAFRQFTNAVFQQGKLSRKEKQLIAVAVAHVTRCPYCIRGHTLAATREGASAEEVMEAIWVAVEMQAGAAFAHSTIALEALPPQDAADDD